MKSSKSKASLRESKINDYLSRIRSAWNQAVESIFAVGDLILEAEQQLHDIEYDFLLNKLPFGPRAAQMLVKIASDNRLRRKSIQKLLPPHWGTLVELNRLTPAEFEIAKEKKLITPEMTREEVISFRREQRGGGTETPSARSSGDQSTSTSPGKTTLIFEIPDDLENPKTLLDLRFLLYLASTIFNYSSKTERISVAPLKLQTHIMEGYKLYGQLMDEAHKLEDHRRRKCGKRPLTPLQKIFSILGADPDRLEASDFSLMEELALAYAERQGIKSVKAQDLKWFSAKSSTKARLVDSFMDEVKNEVESKIQ